MQAIVRCHCCGEETYLPFKCPYCNHHFCVHHRLPENHDCPEIWRARAPKKVVITTAKTEGKPAYTYAREYAITTPAERIVWFSKTELKHLTLGALLVLAVGLSIYFYYTGLTAVVLAFIFTASFIAHELAHKTTAQLQGLWAEFRVIPFGAVLTLLSIFTPFFKMISPGAVIITGSTDQKKMGKTALAGPLVNIALATTFVLITALSWNQSVRLIAAFSAWINAFMAFFNLIPFGVIDGLKVFWWNRKVWLAAFAASLILTVYTGARVVY